MTDVKMLAQTVLASLSPDAAENWLDRYEDVMWTDVIENGEVYLEALVDDLTPDQYAVLQEIISTVRGGVDYTPDETLLSPMWVKAIDYYLEHRGAVPLATYYKMCRYAKKTK